MKLKSFGCSFVFGSDLSDDKATQKYPAASQLTWPAHLAKHLSLPYECYALPGGGNLQIMEQVLNQLHKDEPAIFVIGWTWIDRFDYYTPGWSKKISISPWKTLMPADSTDLAAQYYKNLHSEYKDKLVGLSYIKLVIDMLQEKNIRYVMTYMDELLFDQRWNVSPAVTHLQNTIKSHMTTFEGQTFLDWSRNKGFPESPNWHPLEQAHRAAGDYIIKVFDKQNTSDPDQQVLS